MNCGIPTGLHGRSGENVHILVTGNLGYVGVHLTKLLLENGHDVTGLDLNFFPEAVCDSLPIVGKQIIADFRTITEEALKGIDVVVHLAALSNDPLGNLHPGLTMSINGIGTVEIAKKARNAGVRKFIFSSSCSIYGVSESLPVTEEDRIDPKSEYAKSKVFAELEISKLSEKNFEVYILRNATAFGTSPVFRSDLVVNDLCASLVATGQAEVHSNEDTWRPLINCKDMARAFLLFIEHGAPQLSGKPINVGFSEENFQLKDIRQLIELFFKGFTIKQRKGVITDPRNYRVNFQLLKNTFPQFQAEFPLAESIGPLKSDLQRIGYDSLVRQSKKYVRLAELAPKLHLLIDK